MNINKSVIKDKVIKYVPEILISVIPPNDYSYEDKFKNDNGEVLLLGSFFGKMIYPSDIDINEIIYYNDPDRILKDVQSMSKRVKKNKDIIPKTLLIGIDKNIYYYVGKIDNKGNIVEYNYKKIHEHLDNISKSIGKTNYNKISKLVKKDINYKEFFELERGLKDLYELEWSLDEIIKGSKKRIKLKEVLFTQDIYLEMIIKYDELKFVEATNYGVYEKDGKPLHESKMTKEESRIKEIYYYCYYEEDYFKTIKRLYSLLGYYMFQEKRKNYKLAKMRNEIKKFTCSDIGKFRYLKNNISLNKFLLENGHIELECSKEILQRDSDNFLNLNSVKLDKILKLKDKSKYIKELEKLNEILQDIINKRSLPQLKKYLNMSKSILPFNLKI